MKYLALSTVVSGSPYTPRVKKTLLYFKECPYHPEKYRYIMITDTMHWATLAFSNNIFHLK